MSDQSPILSPTTNPRPAETSERPRLDLRPAPALRARQGAWVRPAALIVVLLAGVVLFVWLRQPAPNTLVMTLGKNGAPVSTRVYTVAKDRKSMTETIIWASTGIPKLETTYFNRVG